MFTELSLLPRKRQTYAPFLRASYSTPKQSTLTKLAMLDFWHQIRTNGQATLMDIQHFTKYYQVNHAIEWFKRETFLYHCVNEALNNDNMEQIYLLSNYIADLHEQIRQLKYQQQHTSSVIRTTVTESHKSIVYFGTKQSDEELNILKSLQGELVTNKSFMLTSRSKKVEIDFAARKTSHTADSLLLLFEIHLDLNLPDIIYADLAKSGENNTNDILLDFGIRFRVKRCEFDSADHVWLCCLEATYDEPNYMLQYHKVSLNECLNKFSFSRNENASTIDTFRSQKWYSRSLSESNFVLLNKQLKLPLTSRPIEWAYIVHIEALMEWQRNGLSNLSNKWINAIQIYTHSDIEYVSDNLNMAYCLTHFGYINHLLGKDTLAIQLIKTALSICRRRLPLDHLFFAKAYQNLGIVFANLGDYKTALTYHKRSINITRQQLHAVQWTTVLILRNMAMICHRSGNFSAAHIYHKKATNVYKEYMDFLLKNDYLIS